MLGPALLCSSTQFFGPLSGTPMQKKSTLAEADNHDP